MGDRPKPIEQIAAEEIASDQARSLGWVASKGYVGLPPPIPWWRSQIVAWGFGIGLVVVVAVVGVVALTRPAAEPPAATPPGVVAGTPTPAAIVPTPTPAPTASPSPLAGFAMSQPEGNALNDNLQPVDDAQVDIIGTEVAKGDSFFIFAVQFAAPLADDAFSDAVLIEVGQQLPDGPFSTFIWQMHRGEPKIGQMDQQRMIIAGADEGVVINRVGDMVSFIVPFAQLPPVVDSWSVISFHMFTPDQAVRNFDGTGTMSLPGEFGLP